MEGLCSGGKGDTCGLVTFAENADLMGIDVSEEGGRLIWPDEMGHEIFKTRDDRVQAIGAKLPSLFNKRIVNVEFLETVKEPLRSIEVAGSLILIDVVLKEVLLSDISQF